MQTRLFIFGHLNYCNLVSISSSKPPTSSVSKHKKSLSKLQDQDPEFYEFLQQEDSKLLQFNDSGSDNGSDADSQSDESESQDEGEDGKEDGIEEEDEEEEDMSEEVSTKYCIILCISG